MIAARAVMWRSEAKRHVVGQALLIGWGLAAAAMLAVYVLARRESVVDVAWTFILGMLAMLYGWLGDGDPSRRQLLALLAGLWSLRLGVYLALRMRGAPEDGRYRTLHEKWGRRARHNFFWFFQVQALGDVVFSVAFLPVAWSARPLSWIDALAIGIWTVAVCGEALADAQLAAFRRSPLSRGRTCREGLWRYSRHPNYFFEWLHWWTYVILARGAALSLVTPVVLLYLLLRVTGIPATEAQALASRGDDYRDYQRTTSAFFPWFAKPRRGSGWPHPGR